MGLPKMPKPTALQVEVVGQEIPLRPLTVAGIDCEVQVRPRLAVASNESVPTAKQVMVLGHEVEDNVSIPSGTVSSDQDKPLVVVEMTIEPVPAFPEFPTAMQSSALKQEIPERSIASAGVDCADQLDPVFAV
jgi:hypothetical protein